MQDDVRKARLQRIVGEVIETIPDAVTVTDENGVIIFANSAAEKILGLSRDDIVGRAYNDVRWNITTLDGGPLPQEEYPFSRVMQEKKTIYGIEYGIERSDGTRLIVSVNAAPLGDEHGAIVGVVAAFTDITEQKRAEDELKRARSELEREVKERTEELSRANATLQQEIIHREQAAEEIRESRREILGILESITDGFFALDNLWRFTYVNKRAEELLQRKKEELLFKNIWEVLPELVDTRFYKEYHRVKEEMTPVSFEARYPQLHRWFEVRVYPYENGLSVYFSDITERKKTEEEVRFKSTLLDSTADSVFVFTLDGKMIFANEAAYKTRGYETEEELLNIPLEKLIAPEYRDLIESRTERMRKGGATFESAHLRKDGTAFPVEVRSRVIDLEGNKVIVSVIRDITGRKRIEDALRTSKTLSDALNDISTSIIATLNFDEIMQRVIIESTKAIGAETAGIDLREDDLWVMRYVYGLPQELLGTHFTDKDFKGSVAAARTREPIVINDAFHDEMANRELVERYNIRSMLIVPLVVRENAIGTLAFHYHSAQIPFTEAQVDFATKLGTIVSLTLENARLYEAKRSIADELQEAILTVPQRIEGIDFGHLYRSATETARVGADFYDLFELGNGRVGIMIGDVSIKGLEAAALTSLVKSTIRAYAVEGGVTEVRCDGGFFGEERLVSFIRDVEPVNAKDMPQAIFDEMVRCANGALSDDVAFLTVALGGGSCVHN